MIWIMGVLTFVAGVANTVQAGSNNTLAKVTGQPILAVLVVTLVNALLYLAVAPLIGVGMPKAGSIGAVPWWAWLGGLFGGGYVLASILFSQRLGSAVFVGLTVTAGIVSSLVMDHFGLLGFTERAASLPRIGGGALMLAGLVLVCLY